MATITWTYSERVEAPPARVFEWMSDFQHDDHATSAFRRGAGIAEDDKRAAKRHVIRHDATTVELKDEWGRKTYHVHATLDPVARTVSIVGKMGYAATWSARPEGDGTRLSVEGSITLRGALGWLSPLFRKGMLREMETDFRGHLEDAREQCAKA